MTLKKNIEFLTIYAKNYDLAKPFHAVKSKTPIDEVLKKYQAFLKAQGEKK